MTHLFRVRRARAGTLDDPEEDGILLPDERKVYLRYEPRGKPEGEGAVAALVAARARRRRRTPGDDILLTNFLHQQRAWGGHWRREERSLLEAVAIVESSGETRVKHQRRLKGDISLVGDACEHASFLGLEVASVRRLVSEAQAGGRSSPATRGRTCLLSGDRDKEYLSLALDALRLPLPEGWLEGLTERGLPCECGEGVGVGGS